MKTAVIYARYSSDKQQETSIEEQLEKCNEYAFKNKLSVIHTYIDRGKSAHSKIEKRTEFLQMIQDSNSFDVLLVYKLDRFSRNNYDSAVYRKVLNDNGVRIVSVTEEMPDTPEGSLMTSFFQSYAVYYSEVLSQRVSAGMIQNAKHCNVLTTLPFGYSSVNKKYVINEKEAEIVRLVFSLYAQDNNMTSILSTLKEKGFKNRNGANFTHSSFARLLANERYKGIYIYKDVRVENGIPRIIDDATFDKVQKRLNNEKVRQHHMKFDYLLSGRMFCTCGARMVGKSAKSGLYRYYSCEKCKINYPVDETDDLVYESVHELFTDEFCVKAARQLYNYLKEKEKSTDLQSLKSELKEKTSTIERMKKLMLLDDTCYELYKDDLKKLNVEISEIKQKLDTEVPSFTYEDCLEFMKSYQRREYDSSSLKKGLITTFVNKLVMLDPSSANLYINVSDDEKLHSFSVVVHCSRYATSELTYCFEN